jgi:hypothetical protein
MLDGSDTINRYDFGDKSHARSDRNVQLRQSGGRVTGVRRLMPRGALPRPAMRGCNSDAVEGEPEGPLHPSQTGACHTPVGRTMPNLTMSRRTTSRDGKPTKPGAPIANPDLLPSRHQEAPNFPLVEQGGEKSDL